MSNEEIVEKIRRASDNIKLWSSNNQDAIKILRPDLGLREWNSLSGPEKEKIWQYLEMFSSKEHPRVIERIEYSIYMLNSHNKYNSFAPKYLAEPTVGNACFDFHHIFHKRDQHVVFELLSYYLRHVLREREKHSYGIYKKEGESDEKFDQRLTEWMYTLIDPVIKRINDVFEHFAVNICCSRQGFLPRQESKIMKEIYDPVLKTLSSSKWEMVNRELKDAFGDYSKKTNDAYSSCVTHAISSLEAFLQILNSKAIGKDKLSNLIKESLRKRTIPNDIFTITIFKNIESVLIRERQKTGDAHPKKEYATEKNARLILNLVMIFIQHCV